MLRRPRSAAASAEADVEDLDVADGKPSRGPSREGLPVAHLVFHAVDAAFDSAGAAVPRLRTGPRVAVNSSRQAVISVSAVRSASASLPGGVRVQLATPRSRRRETRTTWSRTSRRYALGTETLFSPPLQQGRSVASARIGTRLDYALGGTFAFRRKRLSGSYFALIDCNRR